MKNREFLSDLKIDGDHEFRISERPHALPKLYRDKADYKKQIKKSRKTLNALQEKMYAHDRYSLLCIFQAMDAAGKDGTIRAVMSGINPHGVGGESR